MRPEKVFENITDLMRFSSDITGVSEVGTTTTISTSDLKSLHLSNLFQIWVWFHALDVLIYLTLYAKIVQNQDLKKYADECQLVM